MIHACQMQVISWCKIAQRRKREYSPLLWSPFLATCKLGRKQTESSSLQVSGSFQGEQNPCRHAEIERIIIKIGQIIEVTSHWDKLTDLEVESKTSSSRNELLRVLFLSNGIRTGICFSFPNILFVRFWALCWHNNLLHRSENTNLILRNYGQT